MNNERQESLLANRPNLTSVAVSNEPSRFENKLNNDLPTSVDPVLEHLICSRAFKVVTWSVLYLLITLGIVVMGGSGTLSARVYILLYGGEAALVVFVPLVARIAVACSKRLR